MVKEERKFRRILKDAVTAFPDQGTLPVGVVFTQSTLLLTTVGSVRLCLVNQDANLRFPAHCRWGERNISPNPA